MKTLHLVPAYGRDYKSQTEVFDAWKTDVDFKTAEGPYVNRAQVRELIEAGYTHLQFRYCRLYKVALYNLV
jgi:hypothetical protein